MKCNKCDSSEKPITNKYKLWKLKRTNLDLFVQIDICFSNPRLFSQIDIYFFKPTFIFSNPRLFF